MPEITLSRAINTGLRRAMEDDPKVVVMGQDVGGVSLWGCQAAAATGGSVGTLGGA